MEPTWSRSCRLQLHVHSPTHIMISTTATTAEQKKTVPVSPHQHLNRNHSPELGGDFMACCFQMVTRPTRQYSSAGSSRYTVGRHPQYSLTTVTAAVALSVIPTSNIAHWLGESQKHAGVMLATGFVRAVTMWCHAAWTSYYKPICCICVIQWI